MQLEHSHVEQKPDASISQERTANAYEAPAVESVLTPQSLEREVHYAGIVVGSNAAPA